MFNIGFAELLVIGLIALFVIGPKQLPDVARTLAKLFNEFKNATDEFKKTLVETKKETQDEIHKATIKLLETTNELNKTEELPPKKEDNEKT